jgi:ArsR family transcriptional regulator, arsenate/arsenite/antimonite-responsive transcriptional repressor
LSILTQIRDFLLDAHSHHRLQYGQLKLSHRNAGMSKIVPSAGRKPASPRITGLDERAQNRLLRVFKCLSDRHRLQILLLLSREGEQSVGQIAEILQQSQPAISHHLTKLRLAGLLSLRKSGKYNFYDVDGNVVTDLLARAYPKRARGGLHTLHFGDLAIQFKLKDSL